MTTTRHGSPAAALPSSAPAARSEPPPPVAPPLPAAWDARQAALRVSALSVGVVALSAVAGALLPGRAQAAGPALLVAAGVLGLPHGAVDHLALGWAGGRDGRARTGVPAAYAAAAIAAALVAIAVPLPAVLALLVLSAAHFAEGESAYDRLRGGRGLLLPAAALGLAVVALPVELRPAAARPMLLALDPSLPAALAGVRAPVLAVTAVLVAAGIAVALRAGQERAAAELAVVVVAALVAPPLVVFAAWFGGWHAPRHLVRLAALEPAGNGRRRLRRIAVGAAAPTAVALAGLLGLALLLGGLPGAVLIVLLALTVPHAAVVARLDALAGAGRARDRRPLSSG